MNTDRENKRAEVKCLFDEQMTYMKKIAAIAKLKTPKRANTVIKRAMKAVVYALHIRNLEIQKRLVIAIPIAPENLKGCAIVGGMNREIIQAPEIPKK